VDQLRGEGKLPEPGKLATPLSSISSSPTSSNIHEPCLHLNNGRAIPQLAFGCYKVPDNADGEAILRHAIQAGYRHFDTASYYYNEATLGRVLRNSGIPREKFFLSSKVWNDAQKQGRAAVRESVMKSLEELNFGGYWDLFLVHWPVPGRYIDTYHELEDLTKEGKLRAIGLSNFSLREYQALLDSSITVPPVVNQFEVSPFMYRPKDIEYFQTQGNMIVAASKAMYRGGAFDNSVLQSIAKTHGVTPAQVMIRWSLQKNLVPLTMSSSLKHQQQNRSVTHFVLSEAEILQLDGLTDETDVQARIALEEERKKKHVNNIVVLFSKGTDRVKLYYVFETV
jgi:diketogulonate reductase-like aldo/keto reductase